MTIYTRDGSHLGGVAVPILLLSRALTVSGIKEPDMHVAIKYRVFSPRIFQKGDTATSSPDNPLPVLDFGRNLMAQEESVRQKK